MDRIGIPLGGRKSCRYDIEACCHDVEDQNCHDGLSSIQVVAEMPEGDAVLADEDEPRDKQGQGCECFGMSDIEA